jgi:hypothetical protein
MSRLRVGWLFAVAAAITSAACGSEPGPLPHIPTPAEAAANAQVREVFDALRPLVGDAPLECNSNLRAGQVIPVGTATPTALAQWFACADAARSARRPFLIVLEQPPLEGWHLTGVAGRGDGTVRVFNYDEGCCSPRTPTLSAGVCESPSVRSDNGGTFGIRCANENASGLVPVPELWLRRSPLSSDLAERLRIATGGGAIDCGLELNAGFTRPGFSPYFVRQAFVCTQTARASGWPFQLLIQQPGAGSTIVTGLVGTSIGAVSRFSYDSARCGGPGCAEGFEIRPCPRPALVENEDTMDVVCQPPPPTAARPAEHVPQLSASDPRMGTIAPSPVSNRS